MIKVIIRDQEISVTTTPLASDAINHVVAEVQFIGGTWLSEGMHRFVHFKQDTVEHIWELDDRNVLDASKGLFLTPGSWQVAVHGNKFSSDTPSQVVERITTPWASISVAGSSIADSSEPLPGLVGSPGELIIARAVTAQVAAEQAKDDAVEAQGIAGTCAENAASYARAAEAAQSAAEAAQTTAETAAQTASTAAQTATTKAGEASTSATAASTAAQTATTKAGEASTSASTASTAAQTATTKAGEASTSASTASTAAQTATTKAGEASTSASTASTAAQTAATKAGEASTSASTASTAAQTATTKAGEASESAAAAKTAQTAAEEAQAVAETAAQTATTKAGEASTSASTASTAAQTATTKAGEANESAAAAETAAQQSAANQYAAFPTETQEVQNLLSIDLGADNVPMKSLAVNITELGEGVTSIALRRCGKNLFPTVTSAADLELNSDLTRYGRKFFLSAGQYTFTVRPKEANASYFKLAIYRGGARIANLKLSANNESTTWVAQEYTIQDGDEIWIYYSSDKSTAGFVFSERFSKVNIQVELGKVTTENSIFEPYSYTDYTLERKIGEQDVSDVTTMLGNNNLFLVTNLNEFPVSNIGTVSATYRLDPTLAYEKLKAAIIAAGN